jgi:hypothetical protein
MKKAVFGFLTVSLFAQQYDRILQGEMITTDFKEMSTYFTRKT